MHHKKIKTLLLGEALTDDALSHEKLSRIWGLPIMASDAVSSVAYAVEEMLYAMVPLMGLLASRYVGVTGAAVILLLLILVMSYSQTITKYPKGGGAYDVSKDNFGRGTALAAASCLIVGYILTVAVSVASAGAAIVAAYPAAAPYKTAVSVVCVLILTLGNLRGMSESSKIFGIPTYIFIVLMGLMLVTGFARWFAGNLRPIDYGGHAGLLPQESLTLMIFMRAFASGCSGLTGVEAVSNTVPQFRDPPVRTAKHVLYLLGAVIVFLFGGTSFLAGTLGVVPVENTTVISQMAEAVFGKGILFFALQASTALILVLAANTAYNGMPVLLSILAHDRYVPKQFSHRGAKLSFSNGIILISAVSVALLVIFKADTHALIPFYAFGVLVSFTLSQAGMFVKWLRDKEPGWQYKSLINGFGALVTLAASVVVFAMKFAAGAWVIGIVVPLLMWFMHFTHKNYHDYEDTISLDDHDYHPKEMRSPNLKPCIVLIHGMSRGELAAIDYAMDISGNITALHVSRTPQHTEHLKKRWEKMKIGIPLTVIPAPHREILEPLNDYITRREEEIAGDEKLTVVLIKYMGSWRYKMFHNNTSLYIENYLSRHPKVVTVLVSYTYSVPKRRKRQSGR